MERREMGLIIAELAEKIKNMFGNKQIGYGLDSDGLHNFRSSALRIFGEASPENMLRVLQILQDKHLVALTNKGLDDKEFEERCIDVAVYSLIAVGIAREAKKLLVKAEEDKPKNE